MWIDTPNKPGYWLFVGVRTTRTRGYIYPVASPVEIKDSATYGEFMAFYPGSGLGYGIHQHEGKWFYLEGILDDGRKIANSN
jgi:hypothetical protein